MYQALYRSFRPETFDKILGQEHIVKILKNQIAGGATGHAYLFCGTRGTGKTSTARILAKGVNCIGSEKDRPCGECPNCVAIKEGTFLDVIEIDAASNNGVENIRELRESVKYPPAVGRCKVYIVDEVHMLSGGAFNALLKTLEEPPENVMFILATTEPQKLPATILSRCLRLDFRRVTEKQLLEGMREICSKLQVKVSDSALGLIAANADGSVRDGLSLLDQCISAGTKEITRQDVLDFLGTSGEEVFLEMTELVMSRKVAEAILLLDRVLADGKDVRQFMKDWIGHYRGLLMTKYIRNPEDVLNMSEENVERIRKQSEKLDLAQINDGILELSRTLAEAKWSTQPRILLELCIVKLAEKEGASVEIPKTALQKKTKKIPVAAPEESPGKASEDDPKAVPEEAPEKAQEGAHEEAPEEDWDLEAIWRQIFEEGEAQKGSFNLIRRGTSLREITEGTFRVEADNSVALRFAQENEKLLEELMEKYIGKRLKLDCYQTECRREAEEDTPAQDLVEEIGRRFGLEIELE